MSTAQESPRRGLGRSVLWAALLGLIVYAALAAWADFEGVGAALERIPVWAPLAACGLSLANYLVRFPRWQRYVRLVGSDVRGLTSLRVYLAGLSLTVSPGKVGEALKSWLLRDIDGTPLARSAPIVLAERVTDLCGFVCLIALSAGAGANLGVAAAALALVTLVIALVASASVSNIFLRAFARLPIVGTRADRVDELLRSARRLLAPREIPIATALATVGWGLECVGCWLIARSVLPPGLDGTDVLSLAEVTYAFALSAVAGALVIIAPGGLGVTEGVLATLFTASFSAAGFAADTARATALSVTLVTRLCTLWFAMAVGLLSLGSFAGRDTRKGPPAP